MISSKNSLEALGEVAEEVEEEEAVVHEVQAEEEEPVLQVGLAEVAAVEQEELEEVDQ